MHPLYTFTASLFLVTSTLSLTLAVIFTILKDDILKMMFDNFKGYEQLMISSVLYITFCVFFVLSLFIFNIDNKKIDNMQNEINSLKKDIKNVPESNNPDYIMSKITNPIEEHLKLNVIKPIEEYLKKETCRQTDEIATMNKRIVSQNLKIKCLEEVTLKNETKPRSKSMISI